MDFEIKSGKLPGAKKIVVYGPEGIGKSTFASRFPDPLFIDTEGSTKDMDVKRLPKPTSWTMLKEEIQHVKTHSGLCKTLVIDTVDWAESMCVEYICATHHKTGIEDFGYGNGYVYVKEELGRFLNLLGELVDIGINVVLNAHAQIRKFEQPDELGAYDRYELKLGKKTSSQTSPLVKEWADMVLFANYKTYSVATDKDGKKHKAQGGKRVMYTNHHPCWDAKNRYGLPDEVPFDYASIAHIIEDRAVKKSVTSAKTEPVQEVKQETMDLTINKPEPESEPHKAELESTTSGAELQRPEYIPQALWDLMRANDVDEWDIENVVTARGYYPPGTTIKNYRADFVQAKLIGKWPQVYKMIQEMKQKDALVFN